MRGTLVGIGLVIALGACGPRATVVPAPAPPLPTTTEPPEEELPAADRRTSLLFELRGRRFPLPLVRGTVSGVPTLMLVDTGANSHVLSGWLARKLNLPLRKLGELGTDHAGRPVATYLVDRVPVRLEGWGSLGRGPILAADVPEALEAMGIGAFLSPQQLPRDDRVIVLDLPRRELAEAPLDEAIARLAQRGKPLVPRGARHCVDADSTVHGLAFVVPAKLEGKPVELLIDTGALRTDVLAASSVGRGLLPRSVPGRDTLVAASGRITARTVHNANVRIGEHAVTTDVDIVEGLLDDTCPRDGVVAMDVLRHCVLVLSASGAHGRCKIP